jgi:hypothetical protein
MPSNDIFSTYGVAKQAEIIQKFMDLFNGNERGYGVGEVEGAKKNEDKNKWIPGRVRWVQGKAGELEWRLHLSGQRFLGLGPIRDDNTVFFSCIDVDKTEDNVDYEFDYSEEMAKIRRSKLPLVVYRTKSGGLRVTIFFSEPVEAELAIKRMKQIAAQLGYAGQEIFPKQAKLDVEHGDCPSWIYLPYGPTGNGKFPEQCCMNESGNAMELYESVVHAMRMRITQKQFYDLFVEEINAKKNGRTNGKRNPKGVWVKPENEPYETAISTMFWDGPICLWHIAHEKSRHDQHYFLLNCASFFKRKYPDNWDQALEWVNYNVLMPGGDRDKLNEMIKGLKNRGGDRPYEYTCKNPPICNKCFAHACRKQPYGVGSGQGDMDHRELGMTIINREPRIFILNVGDHRVLFGPDDLLTQHRYQVNCLANGVPFPPNMNKNEWHRLINYQIENATIVEPSELQKTNAHEIMALERYFLAHIPTMVRAKGEEYLAGKCGDRVRVKVKEEKIYFKAKNLILWVEKSLGFRRTEVDRLTLYLDKEAEFHTRTDIREWFRSSWSMRFNQFDPGVVHHWLNPDQEEGEEEKQDGE